jgi:hypothetical protein
MAGQPITALVDFAGSLTAGIVRSLMLMAILVGAAWLGVKAAEKSRHGWIGWVVGFVALFGGYALTSPVLDALKEVECKNVQDYQACIEGEHDD